MGVTRFPYHFSRGKVAACAKHCVGDGGTTKGINENNTVIDLNGLLRIHMPAYLNSILKGVATVMVSYSSWNGNKMHANKELVTGYLKDKLRFRVRKVILHKLSTVVIRLLLVPSMISFFWRVLSGFCHIRLGGY